MTPTHSQPGTTEMMDCMVNYASFDDNSEGVPRRYYCYLVVAGPGPRQDSGMATLTTLAVHDGDRPCDYCQNWFFAPLGGPEAAMARALVYLDRYHDGDYLHKAVSQVRRTSGADLNSGVPAPADGQGLPANQGHG